MIGARTARSVQNVPKPAATSTRISMTPVLNAENCRRRGSLLIPGTGSNINGSYLAGRRSWCRISLLNRTPEMFVATGRKNGDTFMTGQRLQRLHPMAGTCPPKQNGRRLPTNLKNIAGCILIRTHRRLLGIIPYGTASVISRAIIFRTTAVITGVPVNQAHPVRSASVFPAGIIVQAAITGSANRSTKTLASASSFSVTPE